MRVSNYWPAWSSINSAFYTPLFFQCIVQAYSLMLERLKHLKRSTESAPEGRRRFVGSFQKAQLSAKPAAMHLFCHMRGWAALQACGLGWLLETAHHYWLLPAWLSHKCKFREKLAFFPLVVCICHQIEESVVAWQPQTASFRSVGSVSASFPQFRRL